MLTIRADQFRLLDREARRDFHHKILDSLRKRLPEQTASLKEEQLLQRIGECHERASSYGIETMQGVLQFIMLALLAAPGFDKLPEVEQFLRRRELSGDQKINLLTNVLFN